MYARPYGISRLRMDQLPSEESFCLQHPHPSHALLQSWARATRTESASSMRPITLGTARAPRPSRQTVASAVWPCARRASVTSHPRLLYTSPSILLAEGPAVDLEISVPQCHATVSASEAANMMLLGCLILQVLPLNACSAASAQTVVQLVIVKFAVRFVIQYVKRCR